MQLIEINNDRYIDDIMEVELDCFAIPWSKNIFLSEFKNEIAIYFGVLYEGKLIAYGGMWKVFDEGHITNIAVHSAYRRKGIGQQIINKLVQFSKENGIIKMTLEVRKSNLAAISLYEKSGFESLGVRKGYYEDNGEDAVIMWKSLNL